MVAEHITVELNEQKTANLRCAFIFIEDKKRWVQAGRHLAFE